MAAGYYIFFKKKSLFLFSLFLPHFLGCLLGRTPGIGTSKSSVLGDQHGRHVRHVGNRKNVHGRIRRRKKPEAYRQG